MYPNQHRLEELEHACGPNRPPALPMQSKRASLFEATVNVLVGYVIAVGSQLVLFPLFDIHVQPGEHLLLGFFFTVVSMFRSYLLRRVFNSFKLGIGNQ